MVPEFLPFEKWKEITTHSEGLCMSEVSHREYLICVVT